MCGHFLSFHLNDAVTVLQFIWLQLSL